MELFSLNPTLSRWERGRGGPRYGECGGADCRVGGGCSPSPSEGDGRVEGGSGRGLVGWEGDGVFGAFSLTPTLSRWERGEEGAALPNRGLGGWPAVTFCRPERGGGISRGDERRGRRLRTRGGTGLAISLVGRVRCGASSVGEEPFDGGGGGWYRPGRGRGGCGH